MDCSDLFSSEKLIGFLASNAKTSIVKSCYSESSGLLALLLSDNVIVYALLRNTVDGSEFEVKSFVVPLNLSVTDFDLSSSGKYCLCALGSINSQLIICPAQALFAEVQVNGPWDTKNATFIDYIPGYYSEIELLETGLQGSPTGGSQSRSPTDYSSLVGTVAIGWYHVTGRDLAVVVHEEHAVSIVDLRERMTIAKGSLKGMTLVDALFLKHDNKVVVKNNESQWYGFSLGDNFSSAISKIAWTRHSSSDNSGSAGSVEAMSASYRTIRSNKEVDVRAKRSKFKNKKKNSSTSKSATGPVAQLISIKPTYYQQFDEFNLRWANSGAPKAKIITALKKQELRLFTTVLDPNHCLRHSLKLLTQQEFSDSSLKLPTRSVRQLFVQEFFVIVQLTTSSSLMPLTKNNHDDDSESEIEIHFRKFLGSDERSSLLKKVIKLTPGDNLVDVYQLGFQWQIGESDRNRSSSLISNDPADQVDPLSTFLIVTNQSVHVIFQDKTPEQIALRFGCNQKLEDMIDICIALRVNNLKPICNFLAAEMVKRRNYDYALRVFATADTPLFMQMDMFWEHGALDATFDYFRQLFLDDEYPEKESKLFAEIIINCYIQQIVTVSAIKASEYTAELSDILRDNFNYTEEIVLRLLLENEMYSLFGQVASQRGLVDLSLSMLANHDGLSVSQECVSAFAINGLIEDYLNYDDGLFLNQLTLSLLLEAIGSNVKLALACRNHVLAGMHQDAVCYYDCFRIATLFNPSREDTILAIGELAKTNKHYVDLDATMNEMATVEETLMSTAGGGIMSGSHQSIDKDMWQKKVQADLIKDACGVFIKALLMMRQLRQSSTEEGSSEVEFRSEYLHHVSPALGNEDFLDSANGAKGRQASRSATLDFVAPVQKPMKRRLCASSDHLGVITAGGNLYMMGSTACGKLGVGELVMQTEYHKALCVETLHMFSLKVKSIACGDMHTVCLTSNGVYSWGSNKFGQLGLGEGFDDVTKPMAVPLFNQEKAVLIACGDYHTLVCTRSPRKVFSFGWGVYGQLGVGSYTNCFKPKEARVPPNTTVISIHGGKTHSTMLTDMGHVYAWGSNRAGQLGIFDGNLNKSTEPLLVKFFNETASVLQTKGFVNIIATGSGRIIKFGCDPNKMQIYISRVKGSRGNANTKPDTLYSEEYFKAPREIVISANLQEDPVVDFSLGNCHILCILESGQVFGCGRNESCQLALPSSAVVNESFSQLRNVPLCKYITALKDTSIAIGEDNKCYLWGKVHSGVVEPNGDSVEELHNGFFCISDPAVISEIPCDDFTKRDEADVQPPMPLPKTDHAFLTNSISRADWSIESITTVQTNWGNSNPLTRLAALPELAEVVEIDGWRFGTNAIFRSIDVLKNFYRFSDVLRMGIKHSFWAFCRNLCALHGYYVRAFIYDLNDLETEIDSESITDNNTAVSSSSQSKLPAQVVDGFYSGFQTALDNVTELMREDRFNAWRGLFTAALSFVKKWNIPTDRMEDMLNSYVDKLEFAGAFHAVIFHMLVEQKDNINISQSEAEETDSGREVSSDYICSLLSPSFLLNTIESTFALRHEVLKGLDHGSSIKNWSMKKSNELSKFVRELHEDDVRKQRIAKETESPVASVQISSQALINAVEGSLTVTIFSCGHISKNPLEEICSLCK